MMGGLKKNIWGMQICARAAATHVWVHRTGMSFFLESRPRRKRDVRGGAMYIPLHYDTRGPAKQNVPPLQRCTRKRKWIRPECKTKSCADMIACISETLVRAPHGRSMAQCVFGQCKKLLVVIDTGPWESPLISAISLRQKQPFVSLGSWRGRR
jgi:hypothetical protein